MSKKTFLLFFPSILFIIILIWLKTFAFYDKFTLQESPLLRIVIIADPQMKGENPNEEEFGTLKDQLNDFYYQHIIHKISTHISPTHIIVLGDIFANFQMNNQLFASKYKRYKRIFESAITNKQIQVINLAGNEDIGYGADCDPNAIQRFQEKFNDLNILIEYPHLSLAIVNNIPLDGSSNLNEFNKSWQFLANLASKSQENQIILFMHIPLYKQNEKCKINHDILFENRNQNNVVIYQNMLSENTSDFIINNIKPFMIFTGHSNSGCQYTHQDKITEYTLRSVNGDFGGGFVVLEIKPNSNGSGYRFWINKYTFPTSNVIILMIILLICYLGFLVGFFLLKIIPTIYKKIIIKKKIENSKKQK
ncbi:metallo phosphoesterase related [Anaeramoeba ignava]|uniref:Metallo phosphoesterase related n=1 Tax=Anaeramoeba ignava TaxID=1746090 RepID=A0A9Q0LXP5_ANAIG|nr:metallo phosphoesterase related [Anaeramoeba ignava]|eukprot:Anaeramoba_ignava/a480102_17.p1 GENE.a480102_17~~a480102_17.p1  ORF type:complete len:364 (-),score=104.27 a480102_17:35-1126(-)